MKLLQCGLLVPLLLISVEASSQNAKELERNLRQAFVSNVSFLRVPYCASRLHFDQKGNLIGKSEVGPWTTYGLLAIRGIRIESNSLQINADRGIAVLRKTQTGTRLVPTVIGETAELRIDLPETVDYYGVKSVISAVLQGGNIEERLSSYWRPDWDLTEPKEVVEREHPDGIVGVLEGNRTVYIKTSRSKLEVPKPIHTPDPEYTEMARRNRTQGNTVIEVVIDEHGFPEILEVSRPLEDGLDIRALAAVARWRSRPALKDGAPVAVKVSVEVSFRLR